MNPSDKQEAVNAARSKALSDALAQCEFMAALYDENGNPELVGAAQDCAHHIRELAKADHLVIHGHIASVYENGDGEKYVQFDVEDAEDIPVGTKLYAAPLSQSAEQDRIDARSDASNPDLAEIREALNSEFKPMFPELQDAWPSPEDAAITACALMIKGICMTKPQDEWTAQIEKRIRFMLKGASND